MSEPPNDYSDWSNNSEPIPRRRSKWGLLLYLGGLFTCPVLFAIPLATIILRVMGWAPSRSAIEGGQETEAMREVLREKGLLDPAEGLQWCFFDGLRLGRRERSSLEYS